ncbi:GNAT family N-acetyltransferase [Mycobacterium xenopi]|uniref:GCN5 family acetyltransferase n=1 Tax=Mycobacterium xenopi TaxID=1789 RepID=A0AAD1H4J6_MYCXE|nr:GNAT family N-acetyltransferase [Mycobacterium xenopi]MDA3640122.1 GNAT family N-acetyltransferase [Mycobacterium xenopi]MDA3658648.1 GNAT family N-acetyltransferase [Mycobacterium xenopi]MDA3660870.1 GNAT family N-acetyltransferase [Mycobacterium xenopi]ORX17146.1 GCN5 family acetyltransferase [Mycobacterium xenopi]SPX90120.1 Putative Gcn5-related N-acetyltransferase [Mycobacterium xenopi]
MVSWPDPGTRVTVRYRRPPGSVPPLTDAVGQLLQVDPVVRVRTKTGTVVQFAPGDAVALRVLTDAPVRTSQIRALEHAAAAAWPGVEQHWLAGWLLRAGHGVTVAANSAVPLDISASPSAIPAIVDWYRQRRLTPRLAVPDRLLRLPAASDHPHQMLVRDVAPSDRQPSVTLAARPDDEWLRLQHRDVPVDVLTAVLGGEVVFGNRAGRAVARGAVTDAPDGTRWVGLSALAATNHPDGPAHAQRLCETLLSWGARRGATRGYIRVDDNDTLAATVADSLGFRLHHRGSYLTVAPELWSGHG